MIKSTGYSCRSPRINYQHPPCGAQSPLTPALEDLTHFFFKKPFYFYVLQQYLGFPYISCISSLRFMVLCTVSGMGTSSLSANYILVGQFQKLCITIVLVLLVGRYIVDSKVCNQVGFYLSSFVVCTVPHSTLNTCPYG